MNAPKHHCMTRLDWIFAIGMIAIGVAIVFITLKTSSTKSEYDPVLSGLQPKDIGDFKDNIAQFKGSIIGYYMTPSVMSPSFNLREHRGTRIPFQLRERKTTLTIMIDVPDDLEVPAIGWTDRTGVYFRCTKGSLEEGNIAVKIIR